MATYIIIGGDGKEYGPITSEDVRKWLAEGRLAPHSLMKAESDAEFRTLEKFPEFADALAGNAPGTIAPLPSSVSLDGDYELDIGDCVSRGFEAVKSNFGMLFCAVLLLMVISMVCGGVIGGIFGLIPQKVEAVRQIIRLAIVAIMALAIGPLTAGVYLLFLRALRGEPLNIGEMFSGFQTGFKDLFLGNLIVTVIANLCLIPFNIVNDAKLQPLLEQLQHLQPGQSSDVQNLISQIMSALGSSLPVMLVCLIPATYFAVSLQFTLPLIIDRQLPLGTALKTGWKMVHKHWWHVFGLTIVVGLVSMVGLIGCGIGVLFTIPIGMAATMAAYETIFKKN